MCLQLSSYVILSKLVLLWLSLLLYKNKTYIREMEIKTIMRGQFTLIRIKKKGKSCGQGVVTLEPYALLVGMSNGSVAEENWWFFRKLNTQLPRNPAIPLLSLYPREMKTRAQADTCMPCSQQYYSQITKGRRKTL